MTAAEWAARVELAACYRLVAHYRMTDLIYTHISARVPARSPRFLINPYGLMFEEITASNLVTVALDGDDRRRSRRFRHQPGRLRDPQRDPPRASRCRLRHSHAYRRRPRRRGAEARPAAAHAARDALHRLPSRYHDYEGVALDLPEQRRLVRDLGQRNAMILRNHGLLTCGATVAEAFDLMLLSRARLPGAGGGDGGRRRAVDSRRSGSAQGRATIRAAGPHGTGNAWSALLRMLDRIDPSYKS